jgi:sRNA-binding protein
MKEESKRWHLLPPEDYNKVFDVLSHKYPKFFIEDKVFIFKKGIHRDIFNDGRSNLSRTVIRKFLTLYSRQSKYRQIHIENTVRYDLKGNEAGVVTKEDVEFISQNTAIKKKQNMLKKSKGEERAAKSSTEYKPDNKANKQKPQFEMIRKSTARPKLGLNFKAKNKNE